MSVETRKGHLVSHLTSRSVCIILPSLVKIPEVSLITTLGPDFAEQSGVSNGHSRCNSPIYPRFLPHLERLVEFKASKADEA